MTSVSDAMAERYGRRKGKNPSRKPIIILAASLTVAFLAWAIWITVDGSRAVKTQDLGYEILSSSQASVRFSAFSPAGPAICAVQVLNQSFSVVGYREVQVPKSGEFELLVNTTELGVTGLVDKCWLK